ncbi:Casein kinase II beta 2 subunit [Pleurostoma richardsiae]|uniref:Casein kinase II beta 2 subunit n=1 Tax=Pleurostoma richardsiae TaxID=41990 RepID=A0AA38RAB1_9PEZI|nr:Casein kinase II beta 2 subunit [Pleurostoma richardsiae]
MASIGGMLAPAAMRALRKAVGSTAKMTKILRTKLADATRSANPELQPAVVRAAHSSGRQPIHPAALLRQSKRGFATYTRLDAAVRRYLSTAGPTGPRAGARFDRSKFPVSSVSRAVSQLPGRAPFASTLRPNLTGGALPRTAGGYAMPGSGRVGGQRYFSHTPAAPAQVVQNVSQAMRAFWLSGQRAHFDGCGANGEKRYRAVSVLQDETARKLANVSRLAPGAFIDFQISPTVTALSPLAATLPIASAGYCAKSEVNAATLNAEGFLDVLSVDFARALKDLAAVMNDLKRLSTLGDLPIQLVKNNVIRVRFPGVDADTVERLCDDAGVMRGVVGEDGDFDASVGAPMTLRFPYAPDAQAERTITSPGGSMRSHQSELSSEEDAFFDDFVDENPWLSLPSPEAEEEGYESMSPPVLSSGDHCSEDFEGLEGIYRFLEECDRAKR